MKALEFIVIVLFVASDGWRDATLWKSWWTRHATKWINLLIPIVYILYTAEYNLYTLIFLAVVCWSVWQLVVNVIYKKGWPSIWIRLIKKVLEWLKKNI